jgi:hypothetical protein
VILLKRPWSLTEVVRTISDDGFTRHPHSVIYLGLLERRFFEGSEHRVDTGLIPASMRLKPFKHIARLRKL